MMNGSSTSTSFSMLLALLLCMVCFASVASSSSDVTDASDANSRVALPKRRYPGNANGAEFQFCLQRRNWKSCKKAKGHAKEAKEEASRRYPGSLHNGNGHAFHHCYWSARMTRDMGQKQARRFGDLRERFSQPALEKKMDKFNNSVGRSVGKSSGNYESYANECASLVNTGELRIYNGNALVPSSV